MSVQAKPAYKSEPVQTPRTDTSVYTSVSDPRPRPKKLRTLLGDLEYRILKYALVNNLKHVTVSELSSELRVDKRRVWDALQRLANRGIVSKIERGLYEVDREKAHVLVQLYEQKKRGSDPKDADVAKAGSSMVRVKSESMSSSRVDRLCCDVVRIHVRVGSGDGILFVHRVIEYAYYLIQFAREYLRRYLRYLGFSRSAVKRFISAALDRVERFMQSIRVFFGVHGVLRYRANGSDITVNLGSKEVGMDIVSDSGLLEKFFIKIYSVRSEKAASRPLTAYVRPRSVSAAVLSNINLR